MTYRRWQTDPYHPSLPFKPVGDWFATDGKRFTVTVQNYHKIGN